MQFDLADGRVVRLVALAQSLTYDGLLEGSPTLAGNKSRVRAASMYGRSHLLDRALDRYNCLPAMEDNFEYDSRLPAVVCHATLRSHRPVLDNEAHGSEMLIAWYQNEFAMPLPAFVINLIIRLDWAKLAADIFD